MLARLLVLRFPAPAVFIPDTAFEVYPNIKPIYHDKKMIELTTDSPSCVGRGAKLPVSGVSGVGGGREAGGEPAVEPVVEEGV